MFKVGDQVRLKLSYADEPRTILTVLSVNPERNIITVSDRSITLPYRLNRMFLELVENLP